MQNPAPPAGHPPHSPSQAGPRTWLLLGQKAGDNNQVLALAEALGWPFEVRHIHARAWELLPHLLLRSTLAGIDRQRSSPLQPPWPELVISAGRRNEPVAQWLRRQAARQGGTHTRLVHIGRPWAHPERYDLVVSTPQYFLPEGGSVICNPLPLHRVRADAARNAALALAPSLAALPRPYTVVLLGGDSGPFVFTPAKAARMGRLVQAMRQPCGGSVLVTDSRRTPLAASEALWQALGEPRKRHSWHASGAGENPYLALLGLADRFVVSGESMSMLAEAAALGRPLYLFDPGDGATPWWRLRHNYRHKPLSHHLAMRLAPLRMRRDVSRIQQALVDSGRAAWLEDAPRCIREGCEPGMAATPEGQDDVGRAAARVRALFEPGRG